jgi:type IV secretory pathway VirB6-like protein
MLMKLRHSVKQIMALMMLLVLTACPEENFCVEADDWGYPKLFVDAKGRNIVGELASQVSEPFDSGQVIIDEQRIPVVITVDPADKWTAWLGMGDSSMSMVEQFLPTGRICHYKVPPDGTPDDWKPQVLKLNMGTCPDPITDIPDPDMYPDCVVPCWLQHGMGLYVGLAHNNGAKHDIVVTRHIPDTKKPWRPFDPDLDPITQNYDSDHQDRDGYLVKGVLDGPDGRELPGARRWDRLYFKIVDSYYDDNVGGYYVRLKEGTRSPEPGVLSRVMQTVLDPVNMLVERMYKGIVRNADFILAVQGALAIYIMFYGFTFVMGGGKGSTSDFVVRVMKIAVVMAMISEDSWEFFHSHLFTIFLDGTAQISSLLLSPFGDFDPYDPWYSLDQMLNKLYSSETTAKVLSTLLSNVTGFLYVIIIELGIVFFIIALVKAVLTYIVTYIMMTILIVIGPIMIVFLLFDKLDDLFKEWIGQFISYAMEIILLMAAVGMFGTLIVSFLEQTIGYRVCWENFFTLVVGPIDVFSLGFWFPSISDTQDFLWFDANQDGVREPDEGAMRYVDLPYLNPESSVDRIKIGEYMSESNFLSFSDVIIFLGAVFLMYHFLPIVPVIAEGLRGGKGKAGASAGGNALAGMFAQLPGLAFDSAKGAAGVLGAYRPDSLLGRGKGKAGGGSAGGGGRVRRGGVSGAVGTAVKAGGGAVAGDPTSLGASVARRSRRKAMTGAELEAAAKAAVKSVKGEKGKGVGKGKGVVSTAATDLAKDAKALEGSLAAQSLGTGAGKGGMSLAEELSSSKDKMKARSNAADAMAAAAAAKKALEGGDSEKGEGKGDDGEERLTAHRASIDTTGEALPMDAVGVDDVTLDLDGDLGGEDHVGLGGDDLAEQEHLAKLAAEEEERLAKLEAEEEERRRLALEEDEQKREQARLATIEEGKAIAAEGKAAAEEQAAKEEAAATTIQEAFRKYKGKKGSGLKGSAADAAKKAEEERKAQMGLGVTAADAAAGNTGDKEDQKAADKAVRDQSSVRQQEQAAAAQMERTEAEKRKLDEDFEQMRREMELKERAEAERKRQERARKEAQIRGLQAEIARKETQLAATVDDGHRRVLEGEIASLQQQISNITLD